MSTTAPTSDENESRHRDDDDDNHDVTSEEEPIILEQQTSNNAAALGKNILICDMGYGLPREGRPRKEKIAAICRQLVNFLEWQMTAKKTTTASGDNEDDNHDVQNHHRRALVQVVGCPDEATRSALHDRMQELFKKSPSLASMRLPPHVTISCDSLEDTCAIINACSSEEIVYLSPDAPESLVGRPPKVAIVGLLIDRRVQPNRSKDRANDLEIVAKRWPLEEYFGNLNPNEPLNVDCVLEGMQQWWWNCDDDNGNDNDDDEKSKEAFVQAAAQAIQHHAQRHPSRPVHLSKN